MDNKQPTDYDYLRFYESLSNWGALDVKRAIEVFKEVGLSSDELADQMTEFADSTDIKLENIDVVYVAYDYLLQMARNKIDEVLSFDFVNDGAEIYTYGNYMCTSYDYSEEQKELLEKKLKEATKEQKEELKEDKETNWFLSEIELIDALN